MIGSKISAYQVAMQAEISDAATTLNEFLHKEDIERFKIIQSCQKNDVHRVGEKTNHHKTICINKLLERETRRISEKTQEVLDEYDSTMMKSCSGIGEIQLSAIHKKAAEKAENELHALPTLTENVTLWKINKKTLKETIARKQKHYFLMNQLYLDKRSRDVKQSASKITMERYMDPSNIRVNVKKDGILGRGGFGTVRIGFIEFYGLVAVKSPQFRGSGGEIRSAERNCIREIELLHHANHDNILRILGYSSWRESLVLITEYMPGGNLSTLLLFKDERGNFLAPELPDILRLRFSSDISSGVTYLDFAFFDQRIVHGDIKPSNVLLTSDLRCKVGDFGGANIATCTEFANLAGNNGYRGEWTQGYVAPERLYNPNLRASKAMDVYSFGMTFFAILRRQHPSIDVNRNKEEVTNYCKHLPFQQWDFKQLIIKCVDHDPTKRPEMLEVRNKLKRLLGKHDDAVIAKNVADVLKTYKSKSFVDSLSDFTPLKNASDF